MVTGGGEKRFHDQISWLMFLFSIFVMSGAKGPKPDTSLLAGGF